MKEKDFDVIVVGAGVAGATAAYVAAKRGKSVLVVERGQSVGSKNMTGGRIYTHSLRSVFDTYDTDGDIDWDKIPFERKITHERIAMMSPTDNLSIDFMGSKLAEKGSDSYSMLHCKFDPWLIEQAEKAGAEVVCGIAVEDLAKDASGAVIGIKAGPDLLTADIVILAEGVNSLLSERALGNVRPTPSQMAVGIKEVYELPAKQIEDRFLCQEHEGAAMLFVGDCTHGNVGGGFMYTNKESISIGLVATIEDLSASDTTIYQAMDDFKKHPAVAPILRDGVLKEHSGHMVPEGGLAMVPQLIFDGCLVAGDAGMLCLNLGYTVRGMDLAIASGRYAAEAACDAIDAGNLSRSGLATYRQRMENSFVIKEMLQYEDWPETMATWSRLFKEYPEMVSDLFTSLFKVDGTPSAPLIHRVVPILKKYGLVKLLGEVKGALKAL